MADQKLNIIFTGDVSQLNKAVQLAVADLAKFEQKLKESLGTEAFAGVNQAVDQLRQKFQSLSTIDIKANPTQALKSLDEISKELAELRTNEVLLKVNGTQALQTIDAIQDEIGSLKLNLDTSSLAKIDALKDRVLNLKINTDIDSVISGIRSKISQLAAIDIKANPEKLFSAVRDVSAELAKLKDSEVFIKLNDSKALAQIQNIDKQLSSLSASITIDANVKTEIDRIKGQLSGLTVKIGADATVAETAIKNIQSKLALLQDEKFILSADGNQAEAVINEIFADLKTLKDTKVLINADGTPAENVIDKLQVDLQTALKGNVLIDTGDLQRKIQQLSISEITLKADASQIDVAVRSIREKLSALQTINIQADPQAALTAINEIFRDIAKIRSSEILLQADNSEALAAINQVQQKVQTIKDKIEVGVNIDTRNLEALIKPLSQKVQLDVSTKQAEAEIKALLNQVKNLKGQDILINLDGTQVVRTIDQIEKELLQLQSKLKSATNPADIARLTQSLQVLKNSLSSVGTNQFSSSMSKNQQATFAFSQVLREAPAFAFSFQTGILALSNNLPILADRLKEARASGLSFGSILGGMAKSLFSLPGILTIASTALIFLSQDFGKAKTASEKFNETIAQESSRGIASLELIRQKLTDLNIPTSKRIELAKQYNETAEKSNQLDLSQINNINAANVAIDKQIKLILERAKARAAESLLAEKFEELFKIKAEFELKFPQFQETELNKLFDKAKSIIDKNIKRLGLDIDKVDVGKLLAFSEVDESVLQNVAKGEKQFQLLLDKTTRDILKGLNAQIAKIKEIRDLEQSRAIERGDVTSGVEAGVETRLLRIAAIEDEINQILAQFGKGIDIKGLLDFNKDLDDETDKIIARARAFVKEFGQTFVVPDLDESFTNTKAKVLKAAIKLLEDVKNLNLKIRVPAKVDVLTEVEVIPILENQKLTEDQLKKLTEGFLQDFQTDKKTIELPIEVNVGNLQLLEQVRKIFKDLKQEIPKDLKLKLLDRESFVDFERLNEAIKQAQNNFLLLQTLSESFSSGISNGLDRVFDALEQGTNVFKALGESVRQLVTETIKAIAKMIILKAITKGLGLSGSGITGGASGGVPGSAGPGGHIINPFSAIGIGSISGRGFVGSAFGGQAAPTLTAIVRGTDLAFVLNQGNNIIGRSG